MSESAESKRIAQEGPQLRVFIDNLRDFLGLIPLDGDARKDVAARFYVGTWPDSEEWDRDAAE